MTPIPFPQTRRRVQHYIQLKWNYSNYSYGKNLKRNIYEKCRVLFREFSQDQINQAESTLKVSSHDLAFPIIRIQHNCDLMILLGPIQTPFFFFFLYQLSVEYKITYSYRYICLGEVTRMTQGDIEPLRDICYCLGISSLITRQGNNIMFERTSQKINK